MYAGAGVGSLEDMDLTGQEDPIVLRAFISAMPAQAAYREGEDTVIYVWMSVKSTEVDQGQYM